MGIEHPQSPSDHPQDAPELTPPAVRKRATLSRHLVDWFGTDWDPAPSMAHPAAASGVSEQSGARRSALSGHFAGQLVVVPAGLHKTRANDTDYPFRAASAFVWLTGETVEGAVLVMAPQATGPGHEATLYIREYQHAGSEGYFTDHRFGAIWVGNVPTPAETSQVLGLPCRPRSELPAAIAGWREQEVAVLTGHDPGVEALLPRGTGSKLAAVIDELRLTKDDWEISALQRACDATTRGFADVVREIPAVLDRPVRGERWLEGTFWRRARLEGNEVGYTSIVGSGAHGTTLHWWRNNGHLRSGELLLADMGVESDEIHTADVTRTFPLDGRWSTTARMVYLAVLEAQQAGIQECRVGNDFLAANHACMRVLAEHLHSWGILDVPPDMSCSADPEIPGAGRHRRYTLHGVSHSLGLDVHDCAQAREEAYTQGPLGANHVLTVEPGLYFQVNDRSVPPEFRGISVRIEDDIQVTSGGPVNLSAALPRDPDEITAWMREVQASPLEF
ncbi:MAG: aminopeptidase P family protein [Candidatus Nanopelagicales bacterium]